MWTEKRIGGRAEPWLSETIWVVGLGGEEKGWTGKAMSHFKMESRKRGQEQERRQKRMGAAKSKENIMNGMLELSGDTLSSAIAAWFSYRDLKTENEV